MTGVTPVPHPHMTHLSLQSWPSAPDGTAIWGLNRENTFSNDHARMKDHASIPGMTVSGTLNRSQAGVAIPKVGAVFPPAIC
jgi:hypothetical protein